MGVFFQAPARQRSRVYFIVFISKADSTSIHRTGGRSVAVHWQGSTRITPTQLLDRHVSSLFRSFPFTDRFNGRPTPNLPCHMVPMCAFHHFRRLQDQLRLFTDVHLFVGESVLQRFSLWKTGQRFPLLFSPPSFTARVGQDGEHRIF